MFQQSKLGKLLMPFFAIFTIVNIIFILWAEKWDALHINHSVVVFGNALLFLLTTFSIWLHLKAVNHKNPTVMVRGALGSTFIKIIIIATSVLLYLYFTPKEQRSKLAVIVVMCLYILYVYIEVRVVLKLNKKKPSNANSTKAS
jgi:hypothetical protein